MPRFKRRRLTSLVCVTLALTAGCGGSAAPTALPTASPSSSVVATPSPTTAATSVAPSTATPVASASGTDVLPGEPWLVYAWYPDKLYLVRPDGSGRHPLEIGVDGEPFAPSWAPDGEQIAFVVRNADSPNGSIWTAATDGSRAEMLYNSEECTYGSFWPVWSPDGSRLAMVCYSARDDASYASVSVLDLQSMERTDLVTLEWPESTDNPPGWSPDGTMLTFEIIKWDPTDTLVESSVVATIATDGDGEVRRLTDAELFGGHPDWSPDGTLIAFNTYDTGNIHGIEEPSNVYTIKPDGTGLTQLSTASVDGRMRLGQPFWSSDGSRIWVSVAYDFESDSNGQPKNTLGWVDAATGDFTEIGTEGKRFRERPAP